MGIVVVLAAMQSMKTRALPTKLLIAGVRVVGLWRKDEEGAVEKARKLRLDRVSC